MNIDNDLKEKNLKGNVKFIKEISYKAIIKVDKVVKGKKEREVDFILDNSMTLIKKAT